MAVVEAGVEEGLEQINSNYGNLTADGWTYNGSVYLQSRSFADGSSYAVSINLSNATYPEITSLANVVPPTLAQAGSSSFFATVGSPNTSAGALSRAVRVRCSKGNLFTASMVAKENIDLNGNGVASDSYDSSNPAKSTGGRYDATKAGDMGDVATNGGITNSVNVQNANIYGKVHTGPSCPVSIGSQGAVGTHAWQATHTGYESGYVLQDANFTFPDTTYPGTTGFLTPLPGNIVTSSNNVTSTSTNTSAYPASAPGGVTTNTSYMVVAILPSPIPAGLTTNSYSVTTNTLPSPVPAGTFTNSISQSSQTYPPAGTYIGGVTTNVVSTGPVAGRGTWFGFNHISGYTYNVKTYNVPQYTYTYDLYNTNTFYFTNFYDNILLADGKYVSSSLNGKTFISGPNVLLAMPNGLSGSENFTFNNGANMAVYAAGTSVAISGNNVINPNGFAGSMIVYCAPSVTSFTLNGNGEFTGVLVAPNASLVMNGGGSSAQDFCGALMVKSVRMNGHFQFHYDEALSRTPSNGRFLITSWDEINPNGVAAGF